MPGEWRPSGMARAGFDFTRQVRQVCVDLVERLPELAHIDLSRVAISVSQARKAGAYGVHASLTPMRFAGGRPVEKRRGRYYKSQVLSDRHGREMLYILSFYLPRFMDVEFREKLTTIVHELWHISPEFDGDIRRHEGRCYAHTGSKRSYDREMGRLVDRWLAQQPPAGVLSLPGVQLRSAAACLRACLRIALCASSDAPDHSRRSAPYRARKGSTTAGGRRSRDA